MTRNVKVASSRLSSPRDIQSDAKTWGELKRDLGKHQIDHSGMVAVVRENKTSLELDEALLPLNESGELLPITLFLMVKKVKGGTAAKKPTTKKAEPKKKAPAKKAAVKKAVTKKEAPAKKVSTKTTKTKTSPKEERPSDSNIMKEFEETRSKMGLK